MQLSALSGDVVRPGAVEDQEQGGTLPMHHIRLAVADCLRDKDPLKRTLEAIQARLWREDPVVVAELHRVAVAAIDRGARDVAFPEPGHRGPLARRMRALYRPPQVRDRRGVTLAEVASEADMDRETLTALLVHQGYLELAPYGRDQRRLLVSDAVFNAEVGHNVPPGSKHSPHLGGHAKSAPFPVFYPENVASILWSLDWGGVREAVVGIPNKRQRLKFALETHGYLPNKTIASLCGVTVRAVEKGRSRMSPVKGHDTGA